MAFVNGYLAVMALESPHIKDSMLSHLQELIEDGDVYGCSMVLAYLTAWLQQLELGQAMWDDEVTKLKLRHALVWHRVMPHTKAASAPSQSAR